MRGGGRRKDASGMSALQGRAGRAAVKRETEGRAGQGRGQSRAAPVHEQHHAHDADGAARLGRQEARHDGGPAVLRARLW